MTESSTVLENILKQSIDTDTRKLEKFTIVKETKKFVSQIKNCLIRGVEIDSNNKKKEFTKYLIVKEIVNSPYFAELFNCDVAFRNEYFSYSKILPVLAQYTRTPQAFPECVYCSENLLILEDLKEAGYKHLNPLTEFTMENVKIILIELANLHSASLVVKKKHPEIFQDISTKTQEILFTDHDNDLLKTQQFRLEMAVKLFETDQRIIEGLKKIPGDLQNFYKSLVSRTTEFDVINHGDLTFSNIMFNDKKMKFIDFQLMRLCSPAADLSYFFYSNLDPIFLHDNYDNLLEFYLKQLLSNISDFSCNAENLTIDWLRSEMDQFRIFGFMHGIWIMPMLFREQQDNNEEEFHEFNELSVEQVLNTMNEAEMNRFKRLIQYFVEQL